jgi:hypothetical protein
VVSENIHRRHLTPETRAEVAAKLADRLAEAARERQLAGKAIPEGAPKGKAAEQAAAIVGGVSPRTVERARRRLRDPEGHERAKVARRAQPKRERDRPEAHPEPSAPLEVIGKTPVVVTDPDQLPPVGITGPEVFPVSWLRTGPADRVARALLIRLGEERLGEIMRELGYIKTVAAAPEAAQDREEAPATRPGPLLPPPAVSRRAFRCRSGRPSGPTSSARSRAAA